MNTELMLKCCYRKLALMQPLTNLYLAIEQLFRLITPTALSTGQFGVAQSVCHIVCDQVDQF